MSPVALQGIQCNLTLIPQSTPRDETAALGQLRLAAALGIQFVDISNLPLRINALTLRHIFVNPRMLLSHITRHLTMQARAAWISHALHVAVHSSMSSSCDSICVTYTLVFSR